MTRDKLIWGIACKKTLEAISKMFLDERNLSRASTASDKVVFEAGSNQEFPYPGLRTI